MIEHIPDKHFKMIQYYGFLSNRKRGIMLPKVYAALDITLGAEPEMPGYAPCSKVTSKLSRMNAFFVEIAFALPGFVPESPCRHSLIRR